MAKDDKEKKSVQSARSSSRGMSPFDEMDRYFDNFFPRGWMRPMPRWDWPDWPAGRAPFEGKVPKVDVIDREGEIYVKAEIPGVEKKDLDITMSEDSVTIKGSTRHEEKEEKGDYHRREISTGSFSRTVPLPSTVDSSKVKASFKDGVLEITVPKIEKTKRRTITIE